MQLNCELAARLERDLGRTDVSEDHFGFGDSDALRLCHAVDVCVGSLCKWVLEFECIVSSINGESVERKDNPKYPLEGSRDMAAEAVISSCSKWLHSPTAANICSEGPEACSSECIPALYSEQ